MDPILVVDDDPDDVELVRRAFRRLRVVNPVRVASDGEEAVAYLAGTGPFADRLANPLPALVLLDLKLPRRSGHEVLDWVKAQPVLRRIPVVVLTSSGERRDVDRAYDLAANSYLVKPVRFDDLVRLIGELNVYWMILNEPPGLGAEGDP
ncbi:MAG TPA: response regulator [Actinomycetota bacterium]|nr:response regulator [Actinomycetota bacterium]